MKIVGLFCGGFSSEFEISIKSANTIKMHFPSGYTVYKIVVKEDQWLVELENETTLFDLNTFSFEVNGQEIHLDYGLVYIHGNPGENGKIQALLDIKGIPYINSGVLASSLSFDKWYCNQFLKSFGIPVAKSLFLQAQNQFSNDEIVAELGLPVFVKPSDSGSSYGISKVKEKEALTEALTFAFNEGKTVVIESFLDGTEVTCGVYRTKNGLHALPLTEICSENEFFDYEAKYNGKSQEITPARVDDSIKEKVQELAKNIYSVMQLKSIARIDFMVVNNVPYVIEVNTTPGFSPASIVPQMIACDGKTITQFWSEILEVELN
jgi:D-alanine-D-alanine ligase